MQGKLHVCPVLYFVNGIWTAVYNANGNYFFKCLKDSRSSFSSSSFFCALHALIYQINRNVRTHERAAERSRGREKREEKAYYNLAGPDPHREEAETEG